MKWVKSITNSNCEYTVSGMYGRKIDEYLNRLESALYINEADSNLQLLPFNLSSSSINS